MDNTEILHKEIDLIKKVTKHVLIFHNIFPYAIRLKLIKIIQKLLQLIMV